MRHHTPGPWTPEFGEAVKVRTNDGTSVCTINWLRGPHGIKGRIPGVEGESNAHLIAAAPELLNALLLIIEEPSHELLDVARNYALEAIAKAEGKA
jgi:hypothetical protein